MDTLEKIRTTFRRAPILGWSASGLLLLSGLLLILGGGESGPTVSGTIQVDGEPLAKGSINFYPVPGTNGPGGGTVIEEGKYQIDKGLAVGKYQVKIQGTRETRKLVPDPLAAVNQIPAEVPVVPPQYNQNSNLFEEVKPGANRIDFKLEGIKKRR